MKAFSRLLDNVYFSTSTNAKSRLIQEYLQCTPDPDRGWALAALAGTLTFDFFKRNTIKQLMLETVDPVLFDLSYDYVGEMSETVAHLWPKYNSVHNDEHQLTLSAVVEAFQQADKAQVPNLLAHYLSIFDPSMRWALLKLGTGGLRVGVSSRALKKCLAAYANIEVQEIESIWHAMQPPYTELLAWLDGKADKPSIQNKLTYYPVMLAQPLDVTKLANLDMHDWIVEWKFDGIRVQLLSTPQGKALYSRTGDDISHSFPDLLETINFYGRFDGELLAVNEFGKIASFNQLQKRLNKKRPSKQLISTIPVMFMTYDVLQLDSKDLVGLPLNKRKKILEQWFLNNQPASLGLSATLEVESVTTCRQLREQANDNLLIEGLMLKRKDSCYQSGRPANQWLKWKRDPLIIDAVVMYAQRGHGKRSSFYSDFTFGAWQGDILLPIGKAYSGFTDEELKRLDNWVRKNTIARFGPVKEVKKELVFEIAFDSIHQSNRHKSGVAMRFPRINRIRWDKPASEADTLKTVKALVKE